MVSIPEAYQRYQAGEALEKIIPPGADAEAWRRMLSRYNPNAKAKARRTSGGHGSKRNWNAAQVLSQGRATVALIERVKQEVIDNGDE